MIKLVLAKQFVLELQWILRLVFSPMQLDFESAPFSHLGTSPYKPGYYNSRAEKNQGLSFLFCQFHNLAHMLHNGTVVFPLMGPQATGTILDPAFRISEIATTLIPQGIQGTVTKQTAEGLGVGTFMAGKILTLFMLKKIIIRHGCAPSVHCNGNRFLL